MEGTVLAVCISETSGTKKKPVPQGRMLENLGLEGDAHARNWHRQVSLLADEDAQTMRDAGGDIGPGDFAENLTTRGLEVAALPVGTEIFVGETARLRVTQIGKTCHHHCEIYQLMGDCVMPRKGIFAEVLAGGEVRPGDRIRCVKPDARKEQP